jgi:plastocyanin
MRSFSGGLALLAVVGFGCGGSDNGTDPDTLVMSLANPSNNVQTGSPGAQLAPFRVQLLRGGSGASGISVNWTVLSGGGTMSVPTSLTDDQGIAQASLTLGPIAGVNTVRAQAAGADGSPITFSATAVVVGEFAQVEVRNNQFVPNSVTINAGGTVAFVWPAGALQHNIVPVAPATRPSSPTVRDGPFSYEEVFNTPGTYDYLCEVHSGMTGRVIVQ